MRLTICSSLQIHPLPHPTNPPVSVLWHCSAPCCLLWTFCLCASLCCVTFNKYSHVWVSSSPAAMERRSVAPLVGSSFHTLSKENTWRIINVTAKHSTCITSSHTLRLSYRSSFWLFFLYYLSEWSHFMKYIGTGLKKYSILFSNKTLSYFPQALCVLCLL